MLIDYQILLHARALFLTVSWRLACNKTIFWRWKLFDPSGVIYLRYLPIYRKHFCTTIGPIDFPALHSEVSAHYPQSNTKENFTKTNRSGWNKSWLIRKTIVASTWLSTDSISPCKLCCENWSLRRFRTQGGWRSCRHKFVGKFYSRKLVKLSPTARCIRCAGKEQIKFANLVTVPLLQLQ